MGQTRASFVVALLAGSCAATLVTVVQLVFRNPPGFIVATALEMGVCAFVSTMAVARAFLRLDERQLPAALLLGLCALSLTYAAFGVVKALPDMLIGSPQPFGAFVALPVFVVFSLPLALPVTLLFAWFLHRRLTRQGAISWRDRPTTRSS